MLDKTQEHIKTIFQTIILLLHLFLQVTVLLHFILACVTTKSKKISSFPTTSKCLYTHIFLLSKPIFMIICFFFLTLSSHSHTYSIVLLSLEITIPISLFITPYRNRSVHYHIKKNLSNEYDAFNICQDFVVTGTSLFSCVIVWVTFG